jgi:micrococcal nuclease
MKPVLVAAAVMAVLLTAISWLDPRMDTGDEHAAGGYRVTRVVDGDTINVETAGGTVQSVRLIGVDTPELRGDECYANEAAAMLTDWLPAGTRVRLEADPSQDDTDRWGRLVRFVWDGGSLVNRALVRAGAGPEYLYDRPYRGRAAFVTAEQAAQREHLGVWGACNLEDRP